MPFIDRVDARRRLAGRLRHLRGEDVVVLALPRGGVPVAFEVASALDAPLDVIVVRKLAVPVRPDRPRRGALAMGAVGEGDVLVLNEPIIRRENVSGAELAEIERQERAEVDRRTHRFRHDRPRLPLAGRTVVLIDDGISTGATARAACQVARAQGAARVVLAGPVCSPQSAAELRNEVDQLVCLEIGGPRGLVAQFYADFRSVSDEKVMDLLRRAERKESPAVGAAGDDEPRSDDEVEIPVGAVRLKGRLTVPEGAVGVVVFAHGSGSSRHSPRNRYVAGVLQQAGLATLLFDLLTPQEEPRQANVFDIELLGGRLTEVTGWVRRRPGCAGLPVEYFGASTGAGAALWAAAAADADIAAVVSRGGRPDLAGPRLGEVRAPTLLIVGEQDTRVLERNRRAEALMRGESRIAVIPSATHLFEEPGTLAAAAAAASAWFTEHLVPAAPSG
ncbi:phosphoribosyltransferase family protein [Pseudonocardia bannensis]|uniref:Phosphoribosyltransferase n=1 Tax=Pseudonocardia bannensis TaxID=630973 RepID=A0A848DSP5_9PSEU|nr:phosphoribosyltransferase family protein [Pseudonocardia bannensis]NMH95244.1 phosphoribosyltransferase [Pseudonocardia bannensis]